MPEEQMGQNPEDAKQPEAATLDEAAVRNALRRVKDPEAGMSIVDLGLVYDIEIEDRKVDVKMTLTSPGCPAGGQILGESEQVVRALDGVDDVQIELVWEPFWTPERIDPKVRAFLGF
jgi:metal-sulfur cluster biosynthetic enzyme